MARASAWCGTCSLLVSRSWLNPGAASYSSSAASGVGSRSTGKRGWLAASHATHAHCSPVSNGAGREASTRGWLAAPSETSGCSIAVAIAAGSETSTRRSLQPGASAQPRTNRPHPPKCVRAWMEPSATEQPQAHVAVPAPPVSAERHLHLELYHPYDGHR